MITAFVLGVTTGCSWVRTAWSIGSPSRWFAVLGGRACPLCRRVRVARLRHGLGELYGYWAQNAGMAANILRDAQVLGHLGVGRRLLALQRDAVEVLTKDWPPADQQQPALAATIRVAVDFHTWQSLVGERGLSEQAAVELAVSWTRCLANRR
jgi:hypothetical protein